MSIDDDYRNSVKLIWFYYEKVVLGLHFNWIEVVW